jgi:hypothetical protein
MISKTNPEGDVKPNFLKFSGSLIGSTIDNSNSSLISFNAPMSSQLTFGMVTNL